MNNYEYVQRLKQNIQEQEKIKNELKQTLNYLPITEEEQEKIITNLLSNEIETYKPTTILPFQKYIKIKLEKEINKLYFTPSTIIPIEEQKIIYLYLNQNQNRFLTEEEIRTNLHTDSKKIYLALKKLRPTSTQEKEELTKLFPNYKQQLKKRHSFFNQTTIISEKDLEYLGYYIGEINDICLDIDEIAKKEGKAKSEIQKSLESTFELLKEEKNIELVKTRYPNCEKMLQIKATNFGIKLNINKEEKTETKKYSSAPKQKQLKRKKEKAKKPQREKSILTEKQEILLKALAKNPNISGKELAKIADYKNQETMWSALSILKRKCQTNEETKAKVLELYPNFLNPKSKQRKAILTKKQETLLKELAKNPNISGKELVKLTGYKSHSNIWKALNTLKKQCETNKKLKEKILELYPDFLNQKTKQKNILLTKKQETILKELAKNPGISEKELTKLVGYKNQGNISKTLNRIKKRCEENEELKEKVLELYPDFFNPKSKQKALLTKNQELLLKELAKNPNITKERLLEITKYKNQKTIYQTISILKKKCKTNEELKAKVLEIYPNFLDSKPKNQNKEKTILTEKQEMILKELAKNPNITGKELAKLTGYKNQNSIWTALNRLKKKCKTNEELKAKVLEIYPNFLEPKPKQGRRKQQSVNRKRPLLTKKQETLLKELAQNSNITGKELAKLTGYKNQSSIWTALSMLKKKCQTNEELKEKVLELYPNFLDPKPKQKRKKQQTVKQERPLLNKKQEIILKELAQNPAIPRKELAKLTEYKNAQSLRQAITMLKKKCETNEEVKAKVLELYPDFLNPKTKQKQEKSLLAKKQEILLKELAQNPNISGKELVKLTGYKNKNTLWATLNRLKKKCKTNEEIKEKVLELYPDFLNPNSKSNTQKQEKSLLAKKQEILLKELAQNPNISGKELVKLAGYKNENSIWSTLSILKKKCETDEELKAKVLKLHPDFLNHKSKQKQTKKSVLTNQEIQILQNIYLITPPKTSYITHEQLSSELNYSESHIHYIKKKALEKIESNPKTKEELQEIWPSFEQDKTIREHYKKGRSIKIPSQDIEKIKSFIRQYDIPENNIQEEKRNNILTGIHNLENSIFSPYVSKCTEEQKAMLALRLGFINAPATTEIVAELFGVEQQEVITLTKNCLQSAKPTLTAKTYQKKKEN